VLDGIFTSIEVTLKIENGVELLFESCRSIWSGEENINVCRTISGKRVGIPVGGSTEDEAHEEEYHSHQSPSVHLPLHRQILHRHPFKYHLPLHNFRT
jgi:hypothetical protein